LLKREIVPLLWELIEAELASFGWGRSPLGERMGFAISKRLHEGVEKYGVPLTTDNGRCALKDAWEEAIDGAQYLIQAYLEGNIQHLQLIVEQLGLSLNIYRAWQDQEERDRKAKADRGTTEADAGDSDAQDLPGSGSAGGSQGVV